MKYIVRVTMETTIEASTPERALKQAAEYPPSTEDWCAIGYEVVRAL